MERGAERACAAESSTMADRERRIGYIQGRLEILSRWIAYLPQESVLAIELAEEYRQNKVELAGLFEEEANA